MKEYRIAIIVTLIAVGSIVASTIYETKHCASSWKDAKYSLLTGCMVNVDGEYLPERNVRAINWVEVE